MGKAKQKRAPARTPEEQEQRMINLAMKQAEDMLAEGRAPSQIVTHFLKLATQKAKIENEKLRAETLKAQAQAEAIEAQKRSEEFYEKAFQAFQSYGGGINFHQTAVREEDYYED